jgi:hypothetical protein
VSDEQRVDSAACPRCGAAREPDQEYCVECGLRLPSTSGAVPALRRRWVRRLRWYPGDWVWNPLLALVIAIIGTAAAIWLPDRGSSNTGTTFVETSPSVPVTTFTTTTTAAQPTGATTTLPAPPEPTTSTKTQPKPAGPPNGKTEWPEGKNGWTVVLVSYPLATGRDAALQKAQAAAKARLPEVGVLVSSRYSSLHPGYFVVFSGIYDSRERAQAARRTARTNGFSGAYERPVTR